MPTKEQISDILDKVLVRIEADPSSYAQTSFCGTACCIAGHIDIIQNGEQAHRARWVDPDYRDKIYRQACEAVGESRSYMHDCWLFGDVAALSDRCDEEEIENFYADHEDSNYWPADLSIAYNYAESKAERVAVARVAIERYKRQRGLLA